VTNQDQKILTTLILDYEAKVLDLHCIR
jgi:hypothetical protein